MLIVTTTDNQPSDFKLLAQNMQNYAICGYTEEEGFDVVEDIPSGFQQRVFPYDRYGKYLSLHEITRYSLIENDMMPKNRADTDYLAIMTGVDLDV